jgi:hypothetical protein
VTTKAPWRALPYSWYWVSSNGDGIENTYSCKPTTERVKVLYLWISGLSVCAHSNKGGAFRCHTLNWLHYSLEPHGVEVWIQILDHSIIRRPGIGRLWPPDGGISARPIVWRCSNRSHHNDKVTLLDGVPTGTCPDLGVVISWVLIRGRCWCRRARCSNRWLEDRCPVRGFLTPTMQSFRG